MNGLSQREQIQTFEESFKIHSARLQLDDIVIVCQYISFHSCGGLTDE